MRIDLRIPIIIAVFYAPGLLLLIAAWVLGYSTEEVRGLIAILGGFIGSTVAWVLSGLLFTEGGPIWWTIPGTKGDSQ